METTLHRQLKLRYAASPADTEVVMGDYRIDAIRRDELIEVQCASLGAINAKVSDLLQRHSVRVVKPVTVRTRIVKLESPGGAVLSRRLSPKRGCASDIFEDLIYFTRVFPHAKLVIESPQIQVNQYRIATTGGRRRAGPRDHRVVDVELDSIEKTLEFRRPADLFDALPREIALRIRSSARFDTQTLARATKRPRWEAQKIAYVLKKVGSIEQVARDRRGIQYQQKSA